MLVLWRVTTGVMLAVTAACASRPAREAAAPRRLARLGAVNASGAGPCAARLRDPETGREYQLRGTAPRDEERVAGMVSGGAPTGSPVGSFGIGTVGAYVPVQSGGVSSEPPLQVECVTLRVLGGARPGG